MTEESKTQAHSDAVVKYLAEKGEAAIDQWQDAVNRARAMLASGEVLPPPDGLDPHLPPPYPWETSEQQMEGPYRVWLGSVSDYATGEGMSIYFFVEFAADEDEFRRSISRRLTREIANQAQVCEGVAAAPNAQWFLSSQLRARLEAFERGEDLPGAMSFYACYRANYS